MMALRAKILVAFGLLLASFTRSLAPLASQTRHSNFSPLISHVLARAPTARTFSTHLFAGTSPDAAILKTDLLRKIDKLRAIQALEGEVSIDFGVKGGELNATSRAPQKVDFYSVSPAVGGAADEILNVCEQLALCNPIPNATQFLGDREQGRKSPLDGTWKLLFSTAADATFSKNSTRGDAQVQNVVNAAKGRITNVINFLPRADGKKPTLKQLNVVIGAKALNEKRVALNFRYAKAVFSRFFFLPIRWSLYIPVPAAFITRLIVLFYRIFRKGQVKRPPKAYFDVMYLDDELRVHKTGEDNIFVQARPTWKAAQGLFE